jgi:hypothetical protein
MSSPKCYNNGNNEAKKIPSGNGQEGFCSIEHLCPSGRITTVHRARSGRLAEARLLERFALDAEQILPQILARSEAGRIRIPMS